MHVTAAHRQAPTNRVLDESSEDTQTASRYQCALDWCTVKGAEGAKAALLH